ncbi:MAG: twin-arginine translocation signal domain-containing protein, partial [Cytophagaceae bacterium]|nr:twin-arginine translocation signal domain-containing protein [Cytophagaceae bacterium]
MDSRRDFLKKSILATAGTALS